MPHGTSVEGPAAENPPESWDFAGWGRSRRIKNLGDEPVSIRELGVSKHSSKVLGEWQATAICGNDITSSCLYVSALSIMVAGAYAPLALLLVAAVLYLFRNIYAEVGSALPLNGGTYTVLLNTTNKKLAAGAACLTLLSYIATAVISAGEAMHYAHELITHLNVFWATVGLLGFFALLNLIGIQESAVVALGIFIIHMAVLSVLVLACGIYVLRDPSTMIANWQNPIPMDRGLMHALYLGFAAAMLGISGFESSANFIEEQKDGVFPKTLRNMWIAVSIFNPLICFLALGLVARADVPQFQTSLLAVMGERSAGTWLKFIVGVDAVLVLSGAVLTSYVGVTGLVRRMSLDGCLPQFFLKENEWRGTNHWIIAAFFLLSCSILLATKAEVARLAGVYTLSFLAVMALYAVGNMLLKKERGRLPAEVRAGWGAVTAALIAVLIGLTGNLTPTNVKTFTLYFGGMAAVVGVMFLRIEILKLCLYLSRLAFDRMLKFNSWVARVVIAKIDEIHSQTMIYFTKGDGIVALNHAALYVLENEQTSNLMVVHCYEDEKDIPEHLAEQLRTVDRLYPELRIDFVAVKGKFGPTLIEQLSRKLDVPKNFMFIGTPGDRFPHQLADLGGVRLIIG
ncbi:MAG: APC family permease [Elusimicrobiota bacterium]